MCWIPPAPPDQDGNLLVATADMLTIQAKTLLPYDATADLDCDGVVGDGDISAAFAHYAHGCEAVTPTLRPSWGGLKIRYR